MLVARQSDPRRDPQARGRTAALEQQPLAGAQVGAGELRPDTERRAQPPRAAAQVSLAHRRVVAPHEGQPLERFERADQHRATDSSAFRGEIEVVASPIHHAHVRVAA